MGESLYVLLACFLHAPAVYRLNPAPCVGYHGDALDNAKSAHDHRECYLEDIGNGLDAGAFTADLVQRFELEQALLDVSRRDDRHAEAKARAASSLSKTGAYCESPIMRNIF